MTDAATIQPGMGAIPDAKGVTFRVWAPHAEKVFVVGTFNVKAEGQPGTFDSAIERLPYLKELGGGPDAFKRLVKAAHDQGIAAIVDVVYNHCGPVNLDGIRWDMIVYIKSIDGSGTNPANDIPDGWSLMQWINEEIRQRIPGKICIAEGMHKNDWVTRDAGAGGAGFNTQWDAEFVHSVRRAVVARDDAYRDLGAVSRAVEHRYDLDAFKRVIYTESHDEVANGRARVPEEIWPGNVESWFSKKRSTLGGALVRTSPGIPMIFEGQELLEDRWFQDITPVDWSRAEDEHGVVVNLMNQGHDGYVIGFPRTGMWKTRFNSDSQDYGKEFANHPTPDVAAHEDNVDGLPCSGKIGIGPYSAVIFSQDE